MSNLDGLTAFTMAHRAPVGLATPFAKASHRIAVRYQEFTVRALSMGLTLDQAKTILDSEGLLGASGRRGSAEEQLEHYACYGYLTVLLGEVLTREELAGQAFGYETILNDTTWMDRTYAKRFAGMGRDRQRGLVKAAIELAVQLGGAEEGWPLERAMAAVMPYLEEA